MRETQTLHDKLKDARNCFGYDTYYKVLSQSNKYRKRVDNFLFSVLHI